MRQGEPGFLVNARSRSVDLLHEALRALAPKFRPLSEAHAGTVRVARAWAASPCFDFESSLPASKVAETHAAASAETHAAASAETHAAASAETHAASSELSAARAAESLAAERFGEKGLSEHVPVLGIAIAVNFFNEDVQRHTAPASLTFAPR